MSESKNIAQETRESGIASRARNLPKHLQALIDILPLNEPVHREALERTYGKSNYARRIRKIVSEYGWDIERFRKGNGPNDDWYVRRSEGPVRQAYIRYEVAPKIRKIVYERDKWICQMCGCEVVPTQSITRAQCDHKTPAERGGSSKQDNLQTLCLQCNLKKRQACRHCDLPTCKDCPYAFPEKYESYLVLRLESKTAQKLAVLADYEGVPPAQIITRLIDSA